MAMLAYLAMRKGQTVTRSQLAGLLWPDSPEDQARTNLRQTLTQLRKMWDGIGHDPLHADKEHVTLDPEGLSIPAAELLSGDKSVAHDLTDADGFLDGFSTKSGPFDDWAAARARDIDARLVSALLEASGEREAAGDVPGACAALSAALVRDPLNEAAHRRLMTMLTASGRSDAALRQFESCRQALAQQLGVEPDAETRQLASRIRSSRLASSAADKTLQPCLVLRGPDGGAPAIEPAVSIDAALERALRHLRDAGGRAAVFLATPDAAHAEAQRLFDVDPDAPFLVSEDVASQSDHMSRLSFDEIDHTGIYRAAEMARHRMQVLNEISEPQQQLAADLSLLILPFADQSPDAAEFSLGLMLAEEITARVSRFGGFSVASPTAAQTCRKLGLSPEDIRQKLGAQFLADGSVFRLGDRLRISVSITDLSDMSTLWSDRFDGTMDDLFESQSLLVDRIATLVAHKTEVGAMERAERVMTGSMTAFDWYLRGLNRHRRAGLSLDNARKAARCFSEAIQLDPDFARAYALRVCSASWFDADFALGQGPKDIALALSRDERDPEVHRIAGAISIMTRDYDAGLHHVQRAVQMNPSDAYLRATSAVYWSWYGEPEKGLEHMKLAQSLDPFLPVWAVEDEGVMLYSLDDHTGAVASLRRLSFPTPRALCFMAASQVAMDDVDAARASIEKVRKIDPAYTYDQIGMLTYYRDASRQDAFRRRLETAGLT